MMEKTFDQELQDAKEHLLIAANILRRARFQKSPNPNDHAWLGALTELIERGVVDALNKYLRKPR